MRHLKTSRAFDNNPETYAELTLYGGENSFIHIVADTTEDENHHTISRIHITAADDSGGKTLVFTTIPQLRPNSTWQDTFVEKLYEDDTFRFSGGTERNVKLSQKKTHFYFAAPHKRVIKIYSIRFYNKYDEVLAFAF